MRVPLLVSAVLLALTPPARAQLTDKQAVAEVKAAGKSELANFKQLGKAALAALDADLKVIEADLDDATTVNLFSSAVAGAATDFLDTMHPAWTTAFQQVAVQTSVALTGLQGGGADGVYPEALYKGAGGVPDAFRKSMLKAASKVRDAARKRLAKCAALAEKQAGLALTAQLELPTVAAAYAANPGEAVSAVEGARIDLVLAVSALDALDDGQLVIAGTSPSLDDVTISWTRTFAESDSTVIEPPKTGRFSADFSGLKEGSYVVAVVQGVPGQDSVGEIGVR